MATVEGLEKKVETNPYLAENYIMLLERYQEQQDGEQDESRMDIINRCLEDVRIKYALYCNPNSNFWKSWITDVSIEVNKDSSKLGKVC